MPSNPDKLKREREVSGPGILFAVARAPGGSLAFFGSSDFGVHAADLARQKPEFKLLGKHDSYVTSVALAGDVLVSGGYDGRLIWWDAEKHEKIRSVDAHRKWVRSVAAAPDGKTLASTADDMVCRLWDAQSGAMLRELRGHAERTPHHFPSMLYACAFAPDGRHLATGDKLGHVVVWDAATGEAVKTLEAPGMYTWDPVQRLHSIGGLRTLAFSPDGELLAAGGIGKIGNIDHLDGKARVEVFDWRRGERAAEYESDKFKGLVERVAFGPGGEWLLAAGGANDGFLFFLDPKTNKALREEKVPVHLHDAALDAGAETLVAAGHGKVLLFSLKG
ncbi:MAG TPA: hypothetical protein VIL46_18285 [Gemmataceae bacterium]